MFLLQHSSYRLISMADLLPSYLCIAKIPSGNGRYTSNNIRRVRHTSRGFILNYSTSTSSSSSSLSVSTSNKDASVMDFRTCRDPAEELDYLVGEFGWKVRRLVRDEAEMREAVQIQAEAFHTPNALFDDLFFEFFKAEVLAGLLYKVRSSPPDRYACLVAEPADESSISEKQLVGIVDATVLRDKDVLQHLPGADEYIYVSGIAVSKPFRRMKIASTLLKACDVLSGLWGFEYLALRAYEDDAGARTLYSNAGYRVVSTDPVWVTWMGRRRRVLMIKKTDDLLKSDIPQLS